MVATSSTLTKLDYVDLVHGEFCETNLDNLKEAFDEFVKSRKKHLAVFFHGGLVSRSDGKAEAEQLIDGYRNAGAYPFFFIWNSGLLTALQGSFFPFAGNLVIRRVVERHIKFFSAQLLSFIEFEASGRVMLSAIAGLRDLDTPPTLTTLGALGRVVDSIWMGRPRGATLPPLEQSRPRIQAFEEDLANDVLAFGGMLDPKTRFTAARGRNIFERLWERFRSGHDHGLYTTLIEEIAITIDLDKILATVWESMKNDIDLAFQCDENHFGGTAFLNALSRVCASDTRLTLVAHSGGTVYIDRMLNAMDQQLPQDFKLDIVFVAAALSFDAFAQTIDASVFRRRVRRYRFFALKDEVEGGYWQIPGVYDKSLLYLLSSLCERDRDADKALVGMQRYWCGNDPYTTPAIRTVTAAIVRDERVWSPTDESALPGYRANARQHGRFPIETQTDLSVRAFLS